MGKTKGFLEDTGIILGFAAVIYGGYTFYETFSKKENISETIEKKQEIKPLIKKEEPVVKKTPPLIEEKKVLKEAIVTKEKTEDIKQTVFVTKKTPPKQEIIIIEKEQKKVKAKNVNIAKLRQFLRDVKFKIARNIVKRDDISSTSQVLKIRITVLKDGSYEQLVFVGGDKKLFDLNKENILKVFPLNISDEIKDDFPRYVRLSIK